MKMMIARRINLNSTRLIQDESIGPVDANEYSATAIISDFVKITLFLSLVSIKVHFPVELLSILFSTP